MNKPGNIKICTRCVMDTQSDPTIRFDEQGQCNYCTEALARLPFEYHPNEQGEQKLAHIFSEIKKTEKEKAYDCVVGISGGLDSSYVIYLGHQYGLRMLAVHIDDGYDTQIAKDNIYNLCKKANVELINVQPDLHQYRALMRSFFLARVPDLALLQDNILFSALEETIKKYNICYSLSGGNFALECILQKYAVTDVYDKKHILSLHKRFGSESIDKLPIRSMIDRYFIDRYMSKIKQIKPLNYIPYTVQKCIDDLSEFSGFTYYGGKHYESILTRFQQCWYLPEKYNLDKRKSHYSSRIVSGDLTREQALELLKMPLYTSADMFKEDKLALAKSIDMSLDEFEALLAMAPLQHADYPMSIVTPHLLRTAVKLRKLFHKRRRYSV